MNQVLQNLVIGVVIGVVVGVASGAEPVYFVVGLVLALSLAVMLFFGSYASRRPPTLVPRTYAAAGVLALVLGYPFYRFMDLEASWWAVGFILAGSVCGAAPLTRPDATSDTTSDTTPEDRPR